MTRSRVLIVGGGVIGSSIAFHLAQAGETSVVVLERDPSYARASSALSASSIRQQFTTPVCIEMSRYGFAFLQHVGRHLAVEGDAVDVGLVERGYLYLADASRRDALERAIAVQQANAVAVERLEAPALGGRYGWLATDDIALGAYGLAGEGWFDGYSLLRAFRRKARSLGVTYVPEEAVGLVREGDRVVGARLANGGTMTADVVVDAAGPSAGRVAGWADLDLPIAPERRCIFAFSCPETLPGLPLVIDPSGLYFRPEGDIFIAGAPPSVDADDDPYGLEVDYQLFDEVVWPTLARRVPAFERIRMTRAWVGHYEMNRLDHNAVIGWVPERPGLLIAAGFSGHGMQHAAAAGRGVAELILDGGYTTLDLGVFGFERIARNAPIRELNII